MFFGCEWQTVGTIAKFVLRWNSRIVCFVSTTDRGRMNVCHVSLISFTHRYYVLPSSSAYRSVRRTDRVRMVGGTPRKERTTTTTRRNLPTPQDSHFRLLVPNTHTTPHIRIIAVFFSGDTHTHNLHHTVHTHYYYYYFYIHWHNRCVVLLLLLLLRLVLPLLIFRTLLGGGGDDDDPQAQSLEGSYYS